MLAISGFKQLWQVWICLRYWLPPPQCHVLGIFVRMLPISMGGVTSRPIGQLDLEIPFWGQKVEVQGIWSQQLWKQQILKYVWKTESRYETWFTSINLEKSCRKVTSQAQSASQCHPEPVTRIWFKLRISSKNSTTVVCFINSLVFPGEKMTMKNNLGRSSQEPLLFFDLKVVCCTLNPMRLSSSLK